MASLLNTISKLAGGKGRGPGQTLMKPVRPSSPLARGAFPRRHEHRVLDIEASDKACSACLRQVEIGAADAASDIEHRFSGEIDARHDAPDLVRASRRQPAFAP